MAATPAAGDDLVMVDETGLLIEDGGATVSAGQHASVVMVDAPASTPVVSLWQSNLLGLRAERLVRVDARPDAVSFAQIAA